MAEPIIVYGKSGTGKSHSLCNFGEDEIFLVNVVGKRLPFRTKFKYTAKTDSIDTIKAGLAKMPCKAAVIDDAGYLMTNAFMRGHSKRGGSSSFDLYNEIADGFWGLMNFIRQELPEDVIVYLVLHEDTSDYGETKLRTIGKLLNDKVCIEGMATVVLRAVKDEAGYHFRTQNSGMDITKSPAGMFEDELIPNDLKAVDEQIRSYWNM